MSATTCNIMLLSTFDLEHGLNVLHVDSTSVIGDFDVPQKFDRMIERLTVFRLEIPFLLHYTISRCSTDCIATAYGLDD
jgi:hypothetical protein